MENQTLNTDYECLFDFLMITCYLKITKKLQYLLLWRKIALKAFTSYKKNLGLLTLKLGNGSNNEHAFVECLSFKNSAFSWILSYKLVYLIPTNNLDNTFIPIVQMKKQRLKVTELLSGRII